MLHILLPLPHKPGTSLEPKHLIHKHVYTTESCINYHLKKRSAAGIIHPTEIQTAAARRRGQCFPPDVLISFELLRRGKKRQRTLRRGQPHTTVSVVTAKAQNMHKSPAHTWSDVDVNWGLLCNK